MMFKPRPKGLGKDNFLKIPKDGEVTGVLMGDVHTFRKHWMGEGKNGVECTGEDCPVCTTDPESRPSTKYRVNFITTIDGQWVPKIFEFGNQVYDQFAALNKKFDLTNMVIDISKTGEKKDTRYHILPRPDMPISKEMKAKIDAVQVLPLSAEESSDVPF